MWTPNGRDFADPLAQSGGRQGTMSFLKRILQAGSGSVIKHAGVTVDAQDLCSLWRSHIRFLDLSGCQSNAFEPDRFVTGLNS